MSLYSHAFSYWLKENDADTEANRISANPYTVTLDADATFTAHFRDRFTLSTDVAVDGSGTATAVYTDTSNGADNYILTATPANYCVFDKWTCGDVEFTDNPLNVSVTESGKTYTAHFKPMALTLGDSAELKNSNSVNTGYSTTISSIPGIPSVGSRTTLYLPVTIPQALTDVTVGLTVTDEQNQELASWTETRSFSARDGYFCATFDPTPEFESLTATLTLTTPAGTSTSTKTYSGLEVAAGAVNNDFVYMTSPGYGYL